jgi:murein L,D-transpeptidase YcbB/YkuD
MPAQFIFDPRATEASRPYDMTKMFENLSENLQRRRGVEDRKEQIRQKLELDMSKGLLPKANIEIGDNGEFIFDNDAAKRAFYSALAPQKQDDLSREASGELSETLMPSTLDAKITRAQNQSAQDPTAVALANAARAMALNIQERTNPGLVFGPNTPTLLQQGGVMSPTNMPTQPTVQPATQPTAEPTPASAPPATTTVQGGFGSVTLPANPLTVSQPPAPAQPAPAPAYTPLSVGARGAAVKAMQKALGLKEDGVFGPNTMAKLKDYQTRNGLQATGQIDQATATKLNLPAETGTTEPTGRFSTKDQNQVKMGAGQLEQMTAQYNSPDIDVSEERYSF